MRRIVQFAVAAACAAPLAVAVAAGNSGGNSKPPSASYGAGIPAGQGQLSRVPVSGLHISPMGANIKNPYGNDPTAVLEGQKLFIGMNCAGCHAPGGGGGMGPPLSDNVWIYGNSDGELYLTIEHGRPNGMPAWGSTLPPQAIWSLISYIRTLQRPLTEYEVKTKLSGPPKAGNKQEGAQPHKRPPHGPKNKKPPQSPPAEGGAQ